jgi:CheY-like chemotaxis protein
MIMPTLLRSEALPQRTVTRRRLSARGEDREVPQPVSGHADASSSRPAPLPRNLVGVKVVVVDDDDASLEYFAAALAACGATVTTASTAIDALKLVQIERPHAVLSDIAMTGEDGYWLVRQIRGLADQGVSAVPVVAATAYGRMHSRARAIDAGFTEHLTKPVDPEVLCRTIGRVLGR